MRLRSHLFRSRFCFFTLSLISIPAFASGERCPARETHRVSLENAWNGKIKGSRDGGHTWQVLGEVKVPVQGEFWVPGRDNGVLAFNFLRGHSSVFASAVNNLHIRFADPEGYSLPADVNIPPVDGHGVTFAPAETLGTEVSKFAGITSIPGGTGIFGPEWSPRIGDKVSVSNGTSLSSIPYDFSLLPTGPKNTLVMITQDSTCDIEFLEFDNFAEGKVRLKTAKGPAVEIAKVKQGVLGTGRFIGSEFISQPGVVRANHAGVLDIGTTDINSDPNVPRGGDINELRGGFQIVPSHHYQDPSMQNGRDHGFVYMVVGPLIDPPHLKRYDMGVEGTAPLFSQGLRAGHGVTEVQFRGSQAWIELNDALRSGKFRDSENEPVYHLRGVHKDVFRDVVKFRVTNRVPNSRLSTGKFN